MSRHAIGTHTLTVLCPHVVGKMNIIEPEIFVHFQVASLSKRPPPDHWAMNSKHPWALTWDNMVISAQGLSHSLCFLLLSLWGLWTSYRQRKRLVCPLWTMPYSNLYLYNLLTFTYEPTTWGGLHVGQHYMDIHVHITSSRQSTWTPASRHTRISFISPSVLAISRSLGVWNNECSNISLCKL